MTKNIYQCNQCEKTFKSSQSLNAHKNKHSKIIKLHKKKQCPTCENNISIQYYQSHIENRKFCLNCGKVFCLNAGQYKKKFCSRSCSSSYNNKGKSKTVKTKDKISNTLTKSYKYHLIWFNNCIKCNTLFSTNRKHKKYCNKCRLTFKKIYKKECSFKLNKYDHPELFNSFLIKKYGWYVPPSCGNNSNINGVTWDHLYPIHEGFKNNVSPEIMSHPANAELVPHKENMRRYKDKEQISYEELLIRIKNWKK